MASTHPPGAGLLAGACLLVGMCLAEGAVAGPNLTPPIGVAFFPITQSMWQEVDLANDPPILATAKGRELQWVVDQRSASYGPTLWNPSGSIALTAAPEFCRTVGLFVDDPGSSSSYPPYRRLEGRSPERISHVSLETNPSAPHEMRDSRGAVRLPFEMTATLCDYWAAHCTRQPTAEIVILSSRLDREAIVRFDCKAPDESYAQCREVEVGQASDRLHLEAMMPEPPGGWRSGEEKTLTCNALVVAGRESDGSLVIRVVDENGGVWGSAQPLWDRRARRTRAALLTPVTAVGDVGIMAIQTVYSAVAIVAFAPLFLIAGLP